MVVLVSLLEHREKEDCCEGSDHRPRWFRREVLASQDRYKKEVKVCGTFELEKQREWGPGDQGVLSRPKSICLIFILMLHFLPKIYDLSCLLLIFGIFDFFAKVVLSHLLMYYYLLWVIFWNLRMRVMHTTTLIFESRIAILLVQIWWIINW